jgi:hypothetical protein
MMKRRPYYSNLHLELTRIQVVSAWRLAVEQIHDTSIFLGCDMALEFQMLMYGTMQVGIRMAHPQAICAFTYVLATRRGLAGMLLFYFAITAAGSSLDEVVNPCKLYPVLYVPVTCASESTFKHLCDARGDKPQNDIINDIITLRAV